MAAPVYLATRHLGEEIAWRALRGLSILMGAGAVLVTIATIRRMVPERPWASVAGGAFVALLPHFQLITVLLSNDASVTLMCSLMLYFAVRALLEPRRALMLSTAAGLAGGLAAMTKMNGLIPVPAALVAVGVAGLLRASKVELDRSSRVLRNVVGFCAAFSLTGGLWIGRHLAVWGTLESDPPWPEYMWPVHTFGAKLWRAIEGLYRSTWTQMGWLPGPHSSPPPTPSELWPRPDLETPILALTLPLAAVAIIGGATLCIRWLRSDETRGRGAATALLFVAFFLAYAAVAHSAIYLHPGRHEAARYALQVVGATMSLFAIGPLVLSRRWRVVCWIALGVLLIVMNGVSFWEMYTYMIPTFAPR